MNAAAPAFYPNLGYDPERDFEPVGLIAELPQPLGCARTSRSTTSRSSRLTPRSTRASSTWDTRVSAPCPTSVAFSSTRPSASSRPWCPSPGTAPVINAMLAGQIDYECDPVLGSLAHVRAGSIKALAIAAKKRSPMLPDVPTSSEQGLPEFYCAPFYAVFAPRARPSPSSIGWSKLSTRASTKKPCRNGLPISALTSRSSSRRGPRRWTTWSEARSRG